MTIKCVSIEKPIKKFICRVLRAAVFNVIFQPERWEEWDVLAETIEGAKEIAQYHFYLSSPENILITEQ